MWSPVRVILCLSVLGYAAHAARVVCYYESWHSYVGVNPEDLDASLCTHINYAFVAINEDGSLKPADDYLDVQQGLYTRLTAMKSRNSNLKVLASIGGGDGVSSGIFQGIARDATKRNTFINSGIRYCQQYGFDGLDIDWEYPAAEDKENYITLLREVKTALGPLGYLVTAAVPSSPQDGYDVPQINQYLDIINIMTYDMYGGSWSSYTGQNSALYPSSVESEWERTHLNIQAASNNWVNAGASKAKMTIGVGFYGRSFALADPNQHGLHAPIAGNGVDDGAPQYSAICTKYSGWTRVWDDEQKTPYLYSGDQWIGYDDPDSIWIKGNYIRDNGFSGAMVWAVDGDDVSGQCGEAQHLLRNLNLSLQ